MGMGIEVTTMTKYKYFFGFRSEAGKQEYVYLHDQKFDEKQMKELFQAALENAAKSITGFTSKGTTAEQELMFHKLVRADAFHEFLMGQGFLPRPHLEGEVVVLFGVWGPGEYRGVGEVNGRLKKIRIGRRRHAVR